MTSKQHKWEPGKEDGFVVCARCGHVATNDAARRGVGPCSGKLPDITGKKVAVIGVADNTGALISEAAVANGAVEIVKSQNSTTEPNIQASEGTGGLCHGCGTPLQQLPLTKTHDMMACNNRRCVVYRERMRLVPAMSQAERAAKTFRPVPKPSQKKWRKTAK